MNQVTTNIIAFILLLAFLSPVFSSIGIAIEDVDPTAESSMLWNNLSEFQQSSNLYDMLTEDGWIYKETTFKDFDYILVMVDQICTMYPNVRPELVLAMIAKESNFNPNDVYNGAIGLMQITRAHTIRLEQFVEDDHIAMTDDFYDIRLNLITGIDYINELLEMTYGDEVYALMCYNQGPTSGTKSYVDHGVTSNYAEVILNLAKEIKPYLSQEVNYVSNPS